MPQENALDIISTVTVASTPFIICEVTLTDGRQSLQMSFDDFNQGYFDRVRDTLSPVLNRVISNLIKSRDYLGLQLNFEFGNISTEQYDESERDFLTETEAFLPDVLKEDIDMLMKLSNRVYNAEEISTMFNCSVEIAEEAIGLVLIDKAE